MGKVKRYVLRYKGKIFFNKQCLVLLAKVCVPKMSTARKDTYKNRKHISWRDDLDYLWKYYKKYITDDTMDLRLYHERRGCTYGSSRFKQTAATQGYKSRGRLTAVARDLVPEVPTFNLEPNVNALTGRGRNPTPPVWTTPIVQYVGLDQYAPPPPPATPREWGFLEPTDVETYP